MGIIKKLNELELVGGKMDRDVYPVTSTKAVYGDNNRSLEKILEDIIAGGGGGGGDIPLQSRTVIAFTHGDLDGSNPGTPVGGSWDIITNLVILPAGWSITDELEPPVWMSSGEFLATDPNSPTWSYPVRISGTNGTDGTDGTSIEFIYYRTKNDLDKPPVPPNNPDLTDYVPKGGWTDSPLGITIDFLAEWVWSRTKKTDGKWNNWSVGALWSKWGVNGKDGDGVEYIFFRNGGAPVDNPTPKFINTGKYNIDTDDYLERGAFDGVEYIPLGGWSDDPPMVGPNPNEKYVWVSLRKRRKGPKTPDGKPIEEFKDKVMWGTFSNPAIWAKYGDDGYNGISLRTMYQKALASESDPPFVNVDNIIPSSEWLAVFPIDYNKETDIVWLIQAYVTYDNKLAEIIVDGKPFKGWQGPWVCSGVNGTDGTPMNYKTYAYKKFEGSIPPDSPSIGIKPDTLDKGWEDYPTTSNGTWWQVIGLVNGVTGLVTEWGKVVPLNGKDGKAQDGKWTEFRFKVSTSEKLTLTPELQTARYPKDGWETTPPTKAENQNMFMITALVNPDGLSIVGKWSTPVKINGERGPLGFSGATGPRGPQGLQGANGVSFAVQYAVGTENNYILPWTDTIPKTNDTYPYIWSRQGRIVQGDVYYENPFRLQGLQGLPGKDGIDGESIPGKPGKDGPIIYPMGIYSPNIKYVADLYRAPYVFDTLFGEFYAYNNSDTPWIGTEQKITPGLSFLAKPYKFWSKLDSFEALYTKIGIIKNGLIGSAVFNGDYMFSQLGIYNNLENKMPNKEVILYKKAKEKPTIEEGPNPSGWSTSRPKKETLLNDEVIYFSRGIFTAVSSGPYNLVYVILGSWAEPLPVSSYESRVKVIYNPNGSLSTPGNVLNPSGWTEDIPSNVILDYEFISYTKGVVTWDDLNEKEVLLKWETPKLLSELDNYSSNFEMFNPEDPYGKHSPWYPNVCINYRTGEAWFATGEVYFDEYGHAKFNGDLKSGNTIFGDANGNHIEIKPDENGETSIEFVDKNKKIPIKLKFNHKEGSYNDGTIYVEDPDNTSDKYTITKIDSKGVVVNSKYKDAEGKTREGQCSISNGGIFFYGDSALRINKVGVIDLAKLPPKIIPTGGGYITNTSTSEKILYLSTVGSDAGTIWYVRRAWNPNGKNAGAITLSTVLSGTNSQIYLARGGETLSFTISGKDFFPRMFIFDGRDWHEFVCG